MRLVLFSILIVCLLHLITGTCGRSYDSTKVSKVNVRIGDDHVMNGDDDVIAVDDDLDDDGYDKYGGFDADDAKKKTMDEMIVEATNEANGFDSVDRSITHDAKNRLVKVEHDMVFRDDELEERYSNSWKDKRTAAIINGVHKGYRWTNHHIPYQFKPNVFTAADKREILAAMDTWAKYTCLTFAPATSGNRIYFVDGKGCTSSIGMTGKGVQRVTLSPGCKKKAMVMHELGHAIGLHHEQTRPDRDQYITLYEDNIMETGKYNFKKYNWKILVYTGIPYDYLSIMHYGSTMFAKNNKVITFKTTNPKYQNIAGRRGTLSFRDIKTVNWIYKCAPANNCKITSANCPGEGFVGTDCKCWCPGDPYVLCKLPASTCKDYNPSCPGWAKENLCSSVKYKTYMTNNCPKSCRLC